MVFVDMYTVLNNLNVRVRPYTSWYSCTRLFKIINIWSKTQKFGDVSTNFGPCCVYVGQNDHISLK